MGFLGFYIFKVYLSIYLQVKKFPWLPGLYVLIPTIYKHFIHTCLTASKLLNNQHKNYNLLLEKPIKKFQVFGFKKRNPKQIKWYPDFIKAIKKDFEIEKRKNQEITENYNEKSRQLQKLKVSNRVYSLGSIWQT